MSLHPDREIIECVDCGLIFRLTPEELEDESLPICHLVPEDDLEVRRKSCKKRIRK